MIQRDLADILRQIRQFLFLGQNSCGRVAAAADKNFLWRNHLAIQGNGSLAGCRIALNLNGFRKGFRNHHMTQQRLCNWFVSRLNMDMADQPVLPWQNCFR